MLSRKLYNKGLESRYLNYKKIDGAGCIICQSTDSYLVENIVKKNKPHRPTKKNEFGMYHEKQWYSLDFKGCLNSVNFIDQLDINILNQYVQSISVVLKLAQFRPFGFTVIPYSQTTDHHTD